MKRFKWVAILVIAVVFSGAGWAGVAAAQTITDTVKKGHTIDGSVYSAGQTVRISGTVNGDVHCAAQDVVIDGTVKGDVLCAAMRIEIRGKVEGSIRVAAQDVLLANTVSRSVSVTAGRVMLTEDSKVSSDVTIAAGETDLRGSILRDATIASGKTTVNGQVARHITYSGGQLSIGDKGVVGGGIAYQSDSSISIADKAAVKGEVQRKKNEEKGSSWLFTLTLFLGLLLFALAMVLIWPQAVHNTSGVAVAGLGKTLVAGLIGLFVVPLALILLAITLIGIPVAIFGFLAWVLIMFAAGPIAGYYLGSMILAKSKNPIIIMLFGASLLMVLYSLPLISFFVSLFVALVGGGAIIRKLKQRIPKPKYVVE